jgi:hypothetical protein
MEAHPQMTYDGDDESYHQLLHGSHRRCKRGGGAARVPDSREDEQAKLELNRPKHRRANSNTYMTVRADAYCLPLTS